MGLTGLSVFALLQVNLVSFAAPIATLSTMDERGTSDRHLAATFAMVLAMGQANVTFPLAPLGLHIGLFILISIIGGLVGSVITYYLLGRNLSSAELILDEHLPHPSITAPKGILAIINHAGGEAFEIAIGTIPILALALLGVAIIKIAGGFSLLEGAPAPLLHFLHIDIFLVVPTLTKYLAGATAVMGLLVDMQRNGQVDSHFLNSTGGWLIHTLGVPGIAILMSSGPRIAKVWKQAVLGGIYWCLGQDINSRLSSLAMNPWSYFGKPSPRLAKVHNMILLFSDGDSGEMQCGRQLARRVSILELRTATSAANSAIDRLLSETEWEYSACGRAVTVCPWGGSSDDIYARANTPRPLWATGKAWPICSCGSKGVVGSEFTAICQQGPRDPGILVGVRDRRHVCGASA